MPLNYNEENLLFLKEKIAAIRFAIFKAEINSELRLPNNIIEILKVEDDGTLWFLTSCNGEHAKTIERSFYAQLDFYRKGTDCRLQLGGNATVTEDDNEAFITISNYSKSVGSSGRLVLIKMKIAKAEYFENKPEPVGSMKERFKIMFNHFFLSNPHRKYNFS
ncbi:MAG: pyridoxamine 5'-phosphate oxidase family protein [Ferruginibacter sp.]